MKDDLRTVTNWLLSASSEVGREYFQLPVAEKEEPEYRERVYCYELYHQWRRHWDARFRYSLAGEIDKSGHPLIRGAPKPDFLVHVPGAMENLLVVEVKPANASRESLRADVAKLSYFTSDAPAYAAGYLWIYGLSEDAWNAIRATIGTYAKDKKVDQAKVSCVLHEKNGEAAKIVSWG